MSKSTSYIVFEADQVLTNDHLNEMFDYLDVEERMTRNKLIGIGIVCGLEIDNLGSTLTISKGCGVTSKGYLIVWDEPQASLELTQYIPYTLPANPLYTPFINQGTSKQYELLRLLNSQDAAKIEGDKKPVGPVLKDRVVVLFLEANEKDLKNCDTQDCNDKGRQVQLTVRPLLIKKADMEAIIIQQKRLSGDDGLSNSYIERLGLKDIPLKRFDVKATPLQDAYDIYNAYLACLNDELFKNVAEAYSQCFSIFQPILKGYGNNNPFKNLQSELKSKLEYYKKSMPIYIQYYYDFLDDLVKAYVEFRDKSHLVITECCPDEDLFPMHLMLGEATVDTVDYVRSPYRQYFISSPLFNNQATLVKEVQVLFDRMVSLVKSLFIPQFNSRTGVPIRITPSTWSQAPLSQRSIPYYYNIGFVAGSWNPQKTARGRSNHNLSYNADKHAGNPPDTVTNPLMYHLEPYDFYRVEGHIGQPFSSVMNVILSQRNAHRLPFDVIALKAAANADNITIQYDCHFEDLELQFALLRAELACKMHEPLCIAAKVPSLLQAEPNQPGFNFLNTIRLVHTLALNDIVARQNLVVTNFVQNIRFPRKGDFLKTYCPIKERTLGAEYMNATSKFFPRPSKIDLSTPGGSRAALMHLIDTTEILMQTITGGFNIYNFQHDNFNRNYVNMNSFFVEFMQALLEADQGRQTLSPLLYGNLEAVVNSCLDQKIKTLVQEYTRRVEKMQKQNLLAEYLSSNPGIDHKAGVPRGGTFIIVYHEAPKTAVTGSVDTLTNLTTAGAANTAVANTAGAASLAATTRISQSNLSKILKLFESNEVKLTADQANTLKALTLQQFSSAAAASRVPFAIADNTVVADFYLPYLCCSDCPPVAYILPKVQQDILLLILEKTDFCNNDEKAYPITANPVGGTVTASAGGVDAEKMVFSPRGLKAGVNKLTYTLPDGRSTSVDVRITEAFDVNFEFTTSPDNPLLIKFLPVNTEGKTVSWNFGDGTALSAEQSPSHLFTLTNDPQTFIVTLTATSGPCSSVIEHEVKLSKPRPQVFTINPRVFCNTDEGTYAFTAEPAVANIADIENPNKLSINRDASGTVLFSPAQQDIGTNTTYTLAYKGTSVQLTIIAITNVEIRSAVVDGQPFARRFTATNINGREVVWDFGDGTPVNKDPSPTHFYQFGNEVAEFTVRLTVSEGPCQTTVTHQVRLIREVNPVFTIEPTAFCGADRTRKVFTIQPLPASADEIDNPDKLAMDRDASSGEIGFIPARQAANQNKSYKLTYRGITIQLTIFKPIADFNMRLERNTSPIAVFPTLLTLTAKDAAADGYLWTIRTVTGASLEFKTRQAVLNFSQLNIPAGSQLTIVLAINYNKQTGFNCTNSKDYVLTEAIFANHLNKGDFDNLTPA